MTRGQGGDGLVVNSDDVILDDIWAWRADHGSGVGWTVNTADTGVVVNGDDVTATGLFVEHFQKYDVIWNGENGKTIFFQNEMPYDAPEPGRLAARRRERLRSLQGRRAREDARGAGGSAATSTSTSTRRSTRRAVSRCRCTPGVKLHDLLTISLDGCGSIDHIVNDTGAPVDASNQVTNVVGYP